MVSAESLAVLKAGLRGRLVEPEDADYDALRRQYNAQIDKRPRLIVRCADVADVMLAVNFARDHSLPLAIRGGGHSGPGFGSCDAGLVIDMTAQREVRVDPVARTVRVAAGCTAADVDHATQTFGLAVPLGIVASTGVAGLTLGGGTGYLTRKFGLTIDNLLEADVVLADGRFVTASPTHCADLFWALRGGGGNFGVVTSFLFKAHAIRHVFGGPIFWSAEHAKQVMQTYRQFILDAPEEFGSFVGLKAVPSCDPFPREHWGKRACALVGAFTGSVDAGQAEFRRFCRPLPAPLFDWTTELPFAALQCMFDPFFPSGMHWYWKGDFVRELSDEAIDLHIAHAAQAPSELSLMHLYPINGAVHRVRSEDTAWSHRQATWNMVITSMSHESGKADALRQWARSYWEAIHPYSLGGGYVNFMMEDEATERLQAAYGENHRRLRDVKTKYDPGNLFRVNQNIPPHEAKA